MGSSRGFESSISQNSVRKHQNMGESRHGSRETIMLDGRRQFFDINFLTPVNNLD